jgi:hypothetical protein
VAAPYKYAVRLRGEVVAYTTTKREAEQEARAIGGTFGPIERNPSEDEVADAIVEDILAGRGRAADDQARANVLLARLGSSEPAFGQPPPPARQPTPPAEPVVRELSRVRGAEVTPYLARDPTRHLFTLLAPKSMVPVAFYCSEHGSPQVGFTPDRSLALTRNNIDYHDRIEIDGDLYARTHMSPGLLNRDDDSKKGLGAIAYIAAALGTADPNPKKPTPDPIAGVWSSRGSRTDAASKAWDDLHQHGVAEYESSERHETVLVNLRKALATAEVAKETDYLKGGRMLTVEWTHPDWADVRLSGEVVFDIIRSAHAASLGLILSVSPSVEAVLRDYIASPPLTVFGDMDLSYVSESALLEFLTQCVGEDEYTHDWRMVRSFVESNPTYPGSLLYEQVGGDLGSIEEKWRDRPRKNPSPRTKRVSERRFKALMAGEWD